VFLIGLHVLLYYTKVWARVANRPVFGACVPSPGLGLPGTQNVPYFREAKVQIFWYDVTPIDVKFHPETLKLMCMSRER